MINGKKFYLTTIPKKECFDMKYIVGGNCGNNMLVLMEESHVQEFRRKFNTENDDNEAMCNFQKHRECQKEAKNDVDKGKCDTKYSSCKQKTYGIDQFNVSDKSPDKDTIIYNITGSPFSYDKPSGTLFAINKYQVNGKESDRVCVDIRANLETSNINMFIGEVIDEKTKKLQLRLGFKELRSENNKIEQVIYYLTYDNTNKCTVDKKMTYQVFLTKDMNQSLLFEPIII